MLRPFYWIDQLLVKNLLGTMAQALPLCMPGKCSISELHPQANQII